MSYFSRKGHHAQKGISSHPALGQDPALLLFLLSPWHFIQGELLKASPLTIFQSVGFIVSGRSGFMSLQLRESFSFHYRTCFRENAQFIDDGTGSSSSKEILLAHSSYKTATTQTIYSIGDNKNRSSTGWHQSGVENQFCSELSNFYILACIYVIQFQKRVLGDNFYSFEIHI